MGARRTEGERAKAAMLWGEGRPMPEILQEVKIDRRTLWEWRKDPEFQRIAGEVVEAGIRDAAQRLRALGPLTVDAFERGLRSTHRQQAMKVKAVDVDEDGALIERIQIVDLKDNALAVQAATKVSERIPELMPRKGVEVDLDASERLAELILRLEGEAGGNDADGAAGTPSAQPSG